MRSRHQSSGPDGLDVARNPALHAGDIRIVKAVDCAALRRLRDVVVVSQLGERDLPNMCASGDLDRDDILIIWDDELIPNEQHEPMNYSAPPAVRSHCPVTQSDIIDCFCKYMKNNSLGSIAVAYRPWVDCQEDGVKNEKCIALIKLHSMAVDYPKIGVPAMMTPALKANQYPHWLNKKFNSYVSHKVLKKLYDEVERVEFHPQYSHRGFDREILAAQALPPKLFDDSLQAVLEHKLAYDEDFRRLMAQYGVDTEFEVWSTFVLDHNRHIKEYKFAEELSRLMAASKQHYRDACVQVLGVTSVSSDKLEDLGSLDAPLYKTTADEVSNEWHGSGGCHKPILSIPWVFQDELLALATMDK